MVDLLLSYVLAAIIREYGPVQSKDSLDAPRSLIARMSCWMVLSVRHIHVNMFSVKV